LFLIVDAPDHRYWRFRYQFNKADRLMGLGSAETATLAQAREARAQARTLLLAMTDPLLTRREEKAKREAPSQTFASVAGLYIAAHEKGGRSTRSWSPGTGLDRPSATGVAITTRKVG
jgi:hypothetical protein